MGAYVLGTWRQKYDEEISKSEDLDPWLTKVLNGRIKGQIQPAKNVSFGPHGSSKYIFSIYQNSINQEIFTLKSRLLVYLENMRNLLHSFSLPAWLL